LRRPAPPTPRVVRDQSNRCVIVCESGGIVLLLVVGTAAAHTGVRIRRVEFDGVVEIEQRTVDLPFSIKAVARLKTEKASDRSTIQAPTPSRRTAD